MMAQLECGNEVDSAIKHFLDRRSFGVRPKLIEIIKVRAGLIEVDRAAGSCTVLPAVISFIEWLQGSRHRQATTQHTDPLDVLEGATESEIVGQAFLSPREQFSCGGVVEKAVVKTGSGVHPGFVSSPAVFLYVSDGFLDNVFRETNPFLVAIHLQAKRLEILEQCLVLDLHAHLAENAQGVVMDEVDLGFGQDRVGVTGDMHIASSLFATKLQYDITARCSTLKSRRGISQASG
jgi:hypothetical protein